jgi:hypothetical protein
VPLQNLIDYVSAGDSLDDFLRSFPTVSREQATAALTEAHCGLDGTVIDPEGGGGMAFPLPYAHKRDTPGKA